MADAHQAAVGQKRILVSGSSDRRIVCVVGSAAATSTKESVELCEEKASVVPVESKQTSRTQPREGTWKKSVPNLGLLPHLVSTALPSTDLMYAEKTRHL